MNREIKFRAWDKELEEMTYIEGESHVILRAISRSKSYHYYMVPASNELMQYTGLKDKNGVEIYEGDILTHKGMEAIDTDGVVHFDWNGAHIHVNGIGNRLDMISHSDSAEGFEVIGNIWENKELL